LRSLSRAPLAKDCPKVAAYIESRLRGFRIVGGSAQRRAFGQALREGTYRSYQAFLDVYPSGRQADELHALIRSGFMGASPPPVMVCPTSETTVFFESERSELNAAARETLVQAITMARSCGIGAVSLVGHDDTSRGEQAALALSLERANVVKAEMMLLGVPESVIETAARGKAELAKPTPEGVREPLNRRVSVTIAFR
jgi:outer membrane protein OmpA-like peptidoglycan-associated protein